MKIIERDRAICSDLFEHMVLTTQQLFKLHFDSERRARKRLLTLTHAHIIERFRPSRTTGSYPHHYIIGRVGLEIVAAERGVESKELGVRLGRLRFIEHSQRFAHLLATNSFFCDLAYACRRLPDASLEAWWGETRCAATWAPLVRPDGFGSVRFGERVLRFFLEMDRGTEELDRLATKCMAYARAARLSNSPDCLLFVLPTVRREAEARRVLGGCGLPTYTAVADLAREDPLARHWLAAGAEQRVSLLEVESAEPGDG